MQREDATLTATRHFGRCAEPLSCAGLRFIGLNALFFPDTCCRSKKPESRIGSTTQMGYQCLTRRQVGGSGT
ncbi:unnamed protein product [Soboliphyme baturini]|uniref:Uncharacterized protein n=1 Tax=Soboliphyme baturini TaxID=241478 RepID=A0A183IVD2_9BILA|nr:unnamed protein product [Soboliphyme baturini]